MKFNPAALAALAVMCLLALAVAQDIPWYTDTGGAGWSDLPKEKPDNDHTAKQKLAGIIGVLEFGDIPLEDAIQFLRDFSGVSICVRWSSLECLDISKETPVNVKLENVTMEKALKVVLEVAADGCSNLDFFVEDGIVIVSTKDDLDSRISTKFYPVGDLICRTKAIYARSDGRPWKIDSFKARRAADRRKPAAAGNKDETGDDVDRENDDAARLLSLLRSMFGTEYPQKYRPDDGTMGIRLNGTDLVVTRSAMDHKMIESMLGELRRGRTLDIGVAVVRMSKADSLKKLSGLAGKGVGVKAALLAGEADGLWALDRCEVEKVAFGQVVLATDIHEQRFTSSGATTTTLTGYEVGVLPKTSHDGGVLLSVACASAWYPAGCDPAESTPEKNAGATKRHNVLDFTISAGEVRTFSMIPFDACGDAAVAVVWLPVEKKAAEPPFDEAFAEAVKTAEAPKEREKYSRFDSCSLTPYARAGMDLATRYPAIDLQKLQKAIAGKKNTPAGRLAWVVLANLADREDARNVILCRAIEGDKTAILAISFMPPVAREDTAAEVVVRCGNTGGMADAIELLGCIGDNGTVEFLEVAAKIPNEDVSLAAARALDCLKEKLRQAPTVQQVWTMYELRYWRTVREIAGADLGDADYDRVVEWLHEKNAKYPVQFLRCRINTGDPLAILLAGLQREKSLIDDLSAAAEAGNSRNRDMAFVSLARIGRWDAMAVLADQMKPDALEDNRNVAKVLASYGTDAAVELLKRLADDENYSRSKPVFEEAVKYLKQRLECESSGFFITGRLFVAGNDVVQSCQEEMLELFVKKTPGITAEYLFGGDWRGIRELADGNVDVAIVSGEGLLLQSEENAFAKAFPATAEQPRSILAGCIGVAFIVHKDNPVKSLGYEQVKDIYLGKIQDWSEVSGGKGKIRVCGMRPWKVAGYCLNAHVGGMKTKVEWREDMEWVNSSDEAMEMVAANPDMIGFISYNGKYPDLGEAKTVGIVKNESAVLPTRESIATMEYPFVYSVRFIVRPGASKLATDYVRFALNDKDAVRIWGLDGFVPASYGEKVRADARLREMQAGKGERVLAAGCAGIKEALADLAVEYARASRPVQLSCAEADSAAAAVAKFVDGGADKCELLVLAGRPDADALKACGGKWNSLGPDGAGPAECIALGRAAAIVVNSANELDALTPDQLRGIFAGYISDWAAVGGKKNLRINRLGLQPGGPAADIFESCCLPAREWFKVAAAKDTGEILKIAGGDPCAIAFVDLAAMPAETQNIKVLGIRIGAGENMKVVMPTPENIRMEAYPLSQRLYLYIHPKAGEAARDFAKFVATSGGSEAGPYADTAGAVKDACGRHGLVPLGGDETRQ